MKKAIIFCFLITISAIGFGQSKNEIVIRAILHKQKEAWNKGDINAFMQTYWNSDSLAFVGKNGVTYGWQNTLDNYKKNYPDKTAMGQLKFEIIKIEALSTGFYNVIGKWHITRTIGNVQGHYTLLIKKFGNRWLIIQDHSS